MVDLAGSPVLGRIVDLAGSPELVGIGAVVFAVAFIVGTVVKTFLAKKRNG